MAIIIDSSHRGLWGINEITHLKHLAWCLSPSRHSVLLIFLQGPENTAFVFPPSVTVPWWLSKRLGLHVGPVGKGVGLLSPGPHSLPLSLALSSTDTQFPQPIKPVPTWSAPIPSLHLPRSRPLGDPAALWPHSDFQATGPTTSSLSPP